MFTSPSWGTFSGSILNKVNLDPKSFEDSEINNVEFLIDQLHLQYFFIFVVEIAIKH